MWSNVIVYAPLTYEDAADKRALRESIMKRLTTIHVSTQRGWHGGEGQARLLVRGLTARGHRCVIFARDGGAFVERMGSEGFEVERIAGSGRGIRAMLHTRRLLRALRPDVIHFHDPHALSGAGLAAWRLPIAARIASRRVDFPIRSTWRYLHLADRIICVSQAVADVCLGCGLDASQVRLVHSGVEPARGRSGDRQRGRKSLGLSDDVIALVCVATLTDHKGHTYLLRAMPAVLKQFPRAQLLLAGDGDLRGALEAEAKSLGIVESVQFLGYRTDVPDLLKAADLFVMPSHMEGLCTSLLDVVFARAPIVACAAGGIPEILGQHAIDGPPVGRLVAPSDPAALAQGIVDSLTNPAELRARIDRAERRAERFFTADRMVENTLAVYREVLAGTLVGRDSAFAQSCIAETTSCRAVRPLCERRVRTRLACA